MKGDLDKDGKLSGYEQARQNAIEKSMREQKAIGGIIRALSAKAKAKLRKELPKRYSSILTPEEAEFTNRATTADDIIKEYEMGENVIFYDTLMGNETAISAETIEEILGKNLLIRKSKQDGGSIDDQMVMVMNMKPMESDEEMENNYTQFIMEEALTEKEEDMLMSKLEQDEELAMLFDKVIDVAQEFAGSGPVEGPGSGVSDSIPARLSDGEFVFTAKATEEIGADELMRMMKDAEAKADKRQEMANGGEPEEETMTRQPNEPNVQEIRVVKETVDSAGRMMEDEDEISKDIKSQMMLDPNQRHVRS